MELPLDPHGSARSALFANGDDIDDAVIIADELIDLFAGPAVLRLQNAWESASFDERFGMLIQYTECWLKIFYWQQLPDGCDSIVCPGFINETVTNWLSRGKPNATMRAAIEPPDEGDEEADDMRFVWLRSFSAMLFPLVEFGWDGHPRASRIAALERAALDEAPGLHALGDSLRRLQGQAELHDISKIAGSLKGNGPAIFRYLLANPKGVSFAEFKAARNPGNGHPLTRSDEPEHIADMLRKLSREQLKPNGYQISVSTSKDLIEMARSLPTQKKILESAQNRLRI